MAEVAERYVIRLSTGEWCKGRDGSGELSWTRVPSWAHQFEDPKELAEVLEYLEDSDHEYSLLQPK